MAIKAPLAFFILFLTQILLLDAVLERRPKIDEKLRARSEALPTSHKSLDKANLCSAREHIPIHGLSLTSEETALLSSLCWRLDMGPETMHRNLLTDRGVPEGVLCNVTKW